ncbi:MAG TPA: hypothetical protein VKP58_08195 [Candidatus Acidoferrum sp.]|nr:hypothetical protein [Candidatus Acidoferrum sp.]
MKPTILAFVLILAVATLNGVLLSGCGPYKAAKAANPAAQQPVNTFESYAYQVLSDTQAGLAETDRKLKSGDLPASMIPDYDRAAVLYNTLVILLNRYDAAFRAGNDVSTVQSEISADLTEVISLAVKLGFKIGPTK